jgi:hypothetical protein
MTRAGLMVPALSLLLWASVAEAQVGGAGKLPEGTFASTPEDCAKLETTTPAELGEDLDFEVLSAKGLVAYQQTCDFVSVAARDATSWVVTAFCEEGGYSYPDLFSIKSKADGSLNVTRVTDLTQQGGDDPEAQSESEDPNMGEEPGVAAGSDDAYRAAEDQSPPESYSSFVKCQTVKQ